MATSGPSSQVRGWLPLSEWLASNQLGVARFFSLDFELVTILAELPQREMVHGSMTPRSFVVDPSTFHVRLVQVQSASLSSKQVSALLPPPLLPGMLAYMSPEQTGRMNRAI